MATSPQVCPLARILVVANLIIFNSKNGKKSPKIYKFSILFFHFVILFYLQLGSLLDGPNIKASSTWEYSCVR